MSLQGSLARHGFGALSGGYELELTEADLETIEFVGGCYGWTTHLPRAYGRRRLSEVEAWEWREAVDADAEGGHSLFPMLDSRSPLYDKLIDLYERIV